MNKVGVSKVGLVQCRDQVKGFCLIPLGTREVGDGKSGHSGSFALESSPSLQVPQNSACSPWDSSMPRQCLWGF